LQNAFGVPARLSLGFGPAPPDFKPFFSIFEFFFFAYVAFLGGFLLFDLKGLWAELP